jgi:hypothetical protein
LADDTSEKSTAPVGIAQAISGYQDSNLTWDDIPFIRVSAKFTKLAIDSFGLPPLSTVRALLILSEGEGYRNIQISQ